LLERVRRVLRPGERPAARVSPSGLLLLLLGGPALLVILWRGTGAAVELVAQVLSPAERIERLETAQAEYAPQVANRDGKDTLKGTIRPADGRPLAGPVWLYHRTEKPGGGAIMGTLEQSRGEFSVEVPAGTTWLVATPEDYAPATVGPFDVRPGRTIDGIAIVLEAGSPAKIAVTDGRGAPVAGARVSAHLVIDGKGSVGASNGWTADRGGVVTIPHALERPYHFTVAAPGYEPLESVELTPSFERTTTLTLTPTRPARGVAVDPEGRPVAGALVRVFREEEENGVHEYHVSGPLLATTGGDGRFTLDSLKARTRYILFVTSKAGGRGISPPVRAGEEGVRVTVGPRLTIDGTIRPRADAGEGASLPAVVDVTQTFRVPNGGESNYRVGWRIPVDPGGHFSIADLLPCETLLEVGGHTVRVTPEKPGTLVTIDLNEPATAIPTRRVVLHVATPDGGIPPSGTISVSAGRPGAPPSTNRECPLENGRAVLEPPVPSQVSYQLRSMVGYWFKDGSIEIEPGEGEKVVEIPAVPAGAIVGEVLEADGRPAASGTTIYCRTVEATPGLQDEVFIKSNVPVDAQGRFFASPLPLGGSYVAIASRGHNRSIGPTVRLDGSRPTQRITMRMARDAIADGRVVGPDGRPLAGVPVKLELVHPAAGQGWMPPTRTDEDGRFRFDWLSSELPGFQAIAQATEGYQPGVAALRPGGLPVEIRLERGHVIEGRVLDARTGWPIPGVSIYAHRVGWVPGERYAYEAQGKTDEQGRFRFSNLPEGSWMLNDRNGLEWVSPHKTHGFGVDSPEPVEIRGTLPGWSDLKPRAPAGP
jgi:protocatechuate 3,4-dioxygenase beta subunit